MPTTITYHLLNGDLLTEASDLDAAAATAKCSSDLDEPEPLPYTTHQPTKAATIKIKTGTGGVAVVRVASIAYIEVAAD